MGGSRSKSSCLCLLPNFEEIDEHFDKRRRENASSRSVVNSQFDMTAYQQQEAYVDKFEEYDWIPLHSYLMIVKAPMNQLPNLEAQLKFVREICGQEIHYDNGTPGVNQPRHQDGRKRVRVGARTGAIKKQDRQRFCHVLFFFNKSA